MYYFQYTNIWDSARALYPEMYKPGQIMCLSFGHGKPLEIGRGGAILLDDYALYKQLKLMCYDGRDLSITPWEEQKEFKLGYHYKPTPEEALLGLEKLGQHDAQPKYKQYPDLRTITINV
jgi:dTDP-4-amino-4,6-dideoxygalactose transaminase